MVDFSCVAETNAVLIGHMRVPCLIAVLLTGFVCTVSPTVFAAETVATADWEADEKIDALEALVAERANSTTSTESAANVGASTFSAGARFAPTAFTANTQAVIYQSDFSSDPGWQTADPANFFWQASTSALFARAYSLPSSDHPGRYFVTETTLDPTRSFTLEGDLKVLDFNGSSVATFGLYADDLRSGRQNQVGGVESSGTFNLELYKLGSFTDYWDLNVVDENRDNVGAGGAQPPETQENVWYHIVLSYDADAGSVSLVATNKETGEPHRVVENFRTGVTFNPDMRFVGVATHPQGLPRTAMGDGRASAGDNAEFLLDNVKLTQEVDNAEPTIGDLSQFKLDGEETVVEGGTFIGNSVVFKANVTDLNNNSVQLEIELKPADQPFDGTNTMLSDLATSGVHTVVDRELISIPEIVSEEGITTSFHWRARARNAEGGVSDWQEFGTFGNTDFTARYTLGLKASQFADQLLQEALSQQAAPDDVYELGARGWDYVNNVFVSPLEIISGYNQVNGFTRFQGFAPGIDCSGLIYWAFNKSIDPFTANDNFVANITADGMFRDLQSDPVAESELQPGDALFFNYDGDARINHVAMYVGDGDGYDVVNAGSELLGVTGERDAIFSSRSTFAGYRRLHQNGFSGRIESGSPVNLVVTDPDGNTLSHNEVISSELELVREVPGEMYYSEIEQGHDGNPVDVVYLPTIKEGTYQIEVVPDPSASPDATYSLTFVNTDNPISIVDEAPVSAIPVGGFTVTVAADETVTIGEVTPEVLFTKLKQATRDAQVQTRFLKLRILGNITLARYFYENDQIGYSVFVLKNLERLIERRTGRGLSAADADVLLSNIKQLVALLRS